MRVRSQFGSTRLALLTPTYNTLLYASQSRWTTRYLRDVEDHPQCSSTPPSPSAARTPRTFLRLAVKVPKPTIIRIKRECIVSRHNYKQMITLTPFSFSTTTHMVSVRLHTRSSLSHSHGRYTFKNRLVCLGCFHARFCKASGYTHTTQHNTTQHNTTQHNTPQKTSTTILLLLGLSLSAHR